MTAIIDENLQKLFAAAINEQQLTQGIVNTAHDAFCAALNERLKAAERLANAAEEVVTLVPNDYLEPFIAAYRQSKEQP